MRRGVKINNVRARLLVLFAIVAVGLIRFPGFRRFLVVIVIAAAVVFLGLSRWRKSHPKDEEEIRLHLED